MDAADADAALRSTRLTAVGRHGHGRAQVNMTEFAYHGASASIRTTARRVNPWSP